MSLPKLPDTPPITVWSNPKLKFCPNRPCNFCDEDQRVIDTHVLNVHPQGQFKIDGTVMTEDDKREALLAQIPDERYQCPFCFTTFPHARATRFFLDDGELSKMALCLKAAGGCGAKMQLASMAITREAPRSFGRFVGSYSKFWAKVDHDEWNKGLKKLYPVNNSLKWEDPNQLLNQFWLGYGDARPEWAQKQKEKQMARDYERSVGFRSDDDREDESGR